MEVCIDRSTMISKAQSVLFYIIEYAFLLILGGSIYYGIEIAFRGHSHITMFLVGGICFIFIGLINEVIDWNMAFFLQMILGDIIVLIVEFVSGVYLNIYLQLGIWDYSNMPFNLMGQICLPFALLWLPIIAIAIVLDDWVKYLLFHGNKPSYHIF